MIQALVGRLARVGQTLDRAHLLTQAAFGGALRMHEDTTHMSLFSKNRNELKAFIFAYKKRNCYLDTKIKKADIDNPARFV